MSITTTVPPPAVPAKRALFATLCAVATVAVAFIAVVALPYFSADHQRLRGYWPVRFWLLLHITAGIVALLSGPVQLWLGLNDRRMNLHRTLGITYVASVAASAAAGYYLAFNTRFGWLFGLGLGGLATAWVVTTGLAFAAIRRHLYDQHKDWMIRSYVVTTAFVSFRILYAALEAAGVGTRGEHLIASSWLCWSVPLLVTEALLQGRRILAARG